MPLIRRLPKFGFRSKNPVVYQIVKIRDLANVNEGSLIDLNFMKNQGFIKSIHKSVKILSCGEIKKSVHVKAHYFSASAKKKILEAGGKAEIIKG